MNDQQQTQILGVSTVAVPVTDQDVSLAFYRDRLGFEVRRDVPFGGDLRWIEVAPSGAVTTVALAPAPAGVATGVDSGIRLVARDAEVAHADLLAHGVDVDPEVLRFPGVPPMFSFRDPDANVLYLVEQA